MEKTDVYIEDHLKVQEAKEAIKRLIAGYNFSAVTAIGMLRLIEVDIIESLPYVGDEDSEEDENT